MAIRVGERCAEPLRLVGFQKGGNGMQVHLPRERVRPPTVRARRHVGGWHWAMSRASVHIDAYMPGRSVGQPLLTFIERVPPIQLPRFDCGGLLLLGSRLIVNPRLAE